MMAVSQLQPNLAVPDWGKVVVQHQRFWADSTKSSSALSRMCKVLSVNQRSWVKGGCSYTPPKPISRGHFQTRAVATEGAPSSDLSPKDRQERQWQEFFLDPTQWWDNRPDKKNPRYPDFRHRRSKQPLWLNDRLKPAWVDSLLAMWDSRITERSVDPRLIAK